ncbi:hypothetical protein [Paenibacillus thiaminolyticus]|uniref:hypothetical protein n=1 Tax=Paenibacillus thiaminolyticus TaxID=49283 RepID=UPI000E6B6EAF|nr:hypothetical protein [Paenibacillus thiaminolyticus]
MTGLEWPQVNFPENYIDINQALVLTENGQPIIDDTKTDASNGIVAMPAWHMVYEGTSKTPFQMA